MPEYGVQSPLWADGQDAPVALPSKGNRNPCLALYGLGPEGVTCKGCAHLELRRRGGRFWKCNLRRESRGAATDHRVRWPACGRYVERTGPVRTVTLD